MKPLIGVTTSEMRSSRAGTLRRHGEPPHAEMALGMTYLRAIEEAGGMPVVLPPLGDAVAYLDRLDGICLSGGPDLDPDAYGAPERHAELGPTEPGLDAFELELARAADARGLPILGICRGAQALNVARGGTLHQHLPGHRQTEPATATTHTVHVEPDSRLADVAGAGRLRVNSFHHQAVDVLGSGLARRRALRRRRRRGDRGAGLPARARRPVARGGPDLPAAPSRAVRRAGAGVLRARRAAPSRRVEQFLG